MKVKVEVNITPEDMANVLVHSGDFKGIIEDEMIDRLVYDFDVDRNEAGDAMLELSSEEFIEILEAVVKEIKKSH